MCGPPAARAHPAAASVAPTRAAAWATGDFAGIVALVLLLGKQTGMGAEHAAGQECQDGRRALAGERPAALFLVGPDDHYDRGAKSRNTLKRLLG
jgi:hypothetical protein